MLHLLAFATFEDLVLVIKRELLSTHYVTMEITIQSAKMSE